MKLPRVVVLVLLGGVVVLPACGKRGDPQPPYSRVPQPVTELALMQRGDVLELRFQAPQATAGGLPLVGLEIEILRADRAGGFESVALRERRPMEPGEETVQSLPLPAVGTPLRIGARALADGRRSPLAGPVTLVVKEPPPAPTDVTALAAADGVTVRWTAPAGWTPPTPAPSPAPGASPPPTPRPEVVVTPAPRPSQRAGRRAGARGGRGGRGGQGGLAGATRPGRATRPAGPFNPGFHVMRRVGDGAWTQVTSTPRLTTEYRDPEPPEGPVCYAVRYAAAAQVESLDSVPACLTPPPPVPPAVEEP